MRILLLGKNGQLGWELQRCLAPLGEVLAFDSPEIDLAQPGTIGPLVEQARPQVIVNATAYTLVDRAESERELALAVNGRAPGILAEAAKRHGSALIHYSTDYVFDGARGGLYREEDATNPLNVYGLSKLEGEQAVQAAGGAWLVLRTSWVYSVRRSSFVTKVLEWARQQETLAVVSDQVGNPTWARMLAEVTAQLLVCAGPEPAGWIGERSGLYHLAGAGHASRLEWARAILEHDPRAAEQRAKEVVPALTRDFPTPAQRPLFSALECSRFRQVFGLGLPDWRLALKLALEN